MAITPACAECGYVDVMQRPVIERTDGQEEPEGQTMSRITQMSLIAVVSISLLAATDRIPFSRDTGTDAARTAMAHADLASLPAVLQPMPDVRLDCAVTSERTFVPSRKAFVMKKVVVCR